MLRLRFFGTPVVWLDDQPLPTLARSPLLTSLLAFLVTYRDQPHSRPVLAAMFWPDLPEARARQYLNTHLSRLRRALKSSSASPYLLSDSQTVQFNAAAPLWLDVAEFEAAMAVLRRTSEGTADLTPEALGGLERAVELYRGDEAGGGVLA